MGSYLAHGPKIYPKAHENLRVFSCIPGPIFLESPNHGSGDGSPPWKDCFNFIKLSHVFPLKYQTEVFLRRACHTEASVDSVAFAVLAIVFVHSVVVDENDGSMQP